LADPVGASDLIIEARERWTRASEAEEAQRKSILKAKQFRAGDQWEAALKLSRAGGAAMQGTPAMPARPCLVVDRLSQPTRQISNIIKQAEFGFDVSSNSEDADDETAQIYKGYLRRMLAQSRGESPIEWAADGAVEGGLGWFRLRADYVSEMVDGQPDEALFDQELKLERIQNSLSVYCDPFATKPTRSDAQWMFVTEDLDRDTYVSLYGEDDLRSLDDFMATGNPICRDWVTTKAIRVAEYWHIDITERYFHQDANGQIAEGEKKAPKGTKQSRVVRVPSVKMDKINAVRSLEQFEWKGSRIPLVPILGEELNVDGQQVLRGIIQEGMDAQRMVNYTYSGAMEIFALGNKSPYIAAAGQIENYKAIWQTANVYNYSHLPYDPIDINGTPVPPPQRDVSEAPIQAAVMLMRTSEEAIKATTSVGDPSLGNTNPVAHSGRAIQALQGQSDLANSNYPDNVRRALIYAGELAVEVIPKITRPGQMLHILGVDDETERVLVGVPFQKDGKGNPQPVPGMTPEMAKLQKGLHEFYDLTAGRYAVTVTVGKATATKREEGAAALGELIPHLPPEMAAVATPDYIEQLSFPGAAKIAEKLRKALPPQFQDPDPNQPQLPPQIQGMIQQLQAQNQQMQQMIQTDQAKAQGQIQVAQAKAQGDLQKAQLDHDHEMRLHQMDNAARIEVARISAAKEAANQASEAQEERLSTGLEQAHEIGMAAMDHQHTLEQAAQGAAHQAVLGQQSAEHQQQQQEGAQSHEAMMAQQAQEAAAQAQEQQGQNGGGE